MDGNATFEELTTAACLRWFLNASASATSNGVGHA